MPLPPDGWVAPQQAGVIDAPLPEPYRVFYRDSEAGEITSLVQRIGAGGSIESSDGQRIAIRLSQEQVFIAILLDSFGLLIPAAPIPGGIILSMFGLHTQESMVSSGTDISVADGPPTDLVLSFFQLHTQRRNERIGREERVSSVDHREWLDND